MEILTAEKIAELTDKKYGLANIRAINKLYRSQDDSHLWPINNKFNVTDRAIRKLNREYTRYNGAIYGLEYCYCLENIMSEIVNNDKNW